MSWATKSGRLDAELVRVAYARNPAGFSVAVDALMRMWSAEEAREVAQYGLSGLGNDRWREVRELCGAVYGDGYQGYVALYAGRLLCGWPPLRGVAL